MIEFREMRRRRQQISEEECISILQKGTSGVLSVLGDNGYPYGVPISYVYHYGRIYFHSATRGHKVDVLARNPKASFTVIALDNVLPEKYTTCFESVICFGNVKFIEDEEEKREILCLLGHRYNPFGGEEGLMREIAGAIGRVLVMEFVPEHISGKRAKELLPRGGGVASKV